MSVKRKCLNLEEKVKAIRLHEKGISCKKISVEMGVGKTQIQNAVNNKVDILDKFVLIFLSLKFGKIIEN